MRLLVPAAVLVAGPAVAHGPAEPAAWAPDPVALALILAGAAAYAGGLARLWGRAGAGRGVPWFRAGAFLGGLVVAAAVLVTPAEGLAGRALWPHMVQHCALMLLAAPLLVLGRPGLVVLWAMPAGWRAGLGRLAAGPAASAWGWLTRPLGAWLIYFAVLWTWHVPALHEAALTGQAVHAVQHASFLAGSMLLWMVLVDRPGAAALIAVFATLAHSVALAALLTVSTRVWYPGYPGIGGMAPLQDQQLAGLIMWVPGCLPLVGAAMWILLVTLRDAERRARRAAP